MKRIKRMTSLLTEEEYGSKYPLSLQETILKHVQMEEASMYKREEIPLPKFEPAKIENEKPGWVNFFIGLREGLLEFRP